MATWKNLDTLASYSKLAELKGHVNIADAMAGEKGAERVKKYSTPMAAGLTYNYAAKQVDETVLDALAQLADEAELIDKFQELYNGAVINTGEKRMVLHHLARTQLGEDVVVDGVNKREFYVAQQKKAADFANKVHAGEITNENGEKFTTVVQIGIGGSDLGPRALYIALENWAKANNTSKMEAKFISNVDPDDAAAVLASVDLAHALFIVVSKSGTTLETLTNEAFVKNALVKAGLNPSKHMLAVTSEIDEEMKQKLNEMHVGRLIHILSHTMKRHNPAEVMENDDLTTMQKHVLKFILLETMHRDLYQKDIEEEFQIRKPTVTGILKLMEKNGYIYRESAKQDARLKQIIPTEKAEKIRPAILKSIEEGEAKMLRGIPKEDVELCKQVLWQMYENRKKSCDSRNDF
jgi:DNA-binding MarR family transcriptional regulator